MNNAETRRRHIATLALALALTAPGAGCGDSGEDTDAMTQGTGETEAASSTTEAATGTTTAGSGATTTMGSSGSMTASTDATSTTTTTATTTVDTDPATTTTATTSFDDPVMGFFVSSTGSATGNLGGLNGADKRCQELADAVGVGDRTWRAYLSAEKGDDDQPVHARDRIGQGPWYNANWALVAQDLDELHALDGDPELFVDENGDMINGQWEGSPDPNEHDILTGTDRDGYLMPGLTCADWSSEDPSLFAQVGHSDGLGPMGSDDEIYRPWNSVHESGGCNDTAPKGGAGKIYCFAAD